MRITQGTAARRTWEVTTDTGAPVLDWAGWTARAQARATADAADPPLFEWSTAEGTLELVAATVVDDLLLTPAYLRLLTPANASTAWATGEFVYDVAITNPDGDVVARIPQDKLVVTAAVTRG